MPLGRSLRARDGRIRRVAEKADAHRWITLDAPESILQKETIVRKAAVDDEEVIPGLGWAVEGYEHRPQIVLRAALEVVHDVHRCGGGEKRDDDEQYEREGPEPE